MKQLEQKKVWSDLPQRRDGRIVARRPAAEAAEWPLEPGRHTVAAIDAAGRTAQGEFVVR